MILYPDYILPISSPPLKNQAIVLGGASIAAIGPLSEIKSQFPGYQVFRLKKIALLPGFINMHAHMELSFLKGLLEKNLPFPDWVGKLNALKKDCTPEDIKTGMAVGEEILIKSGVTTVLDIVSKFGRPAKFKAKKIKRHIFLEILGFKESDAEDLAKQTLEWYDEINNSKVGLSPHAPFTTSLGLYKRLKQFSEKNSLLTTTHLAESQAEIDFFHGRGNTITDLLIKHNQYDENWSPPHISPVRYLEEFMDSSTILAHVNYLQPGDMDLLARTKPTIVTCPESNRFFGRENKNIEKFLKMGIMVTLGTDSMASNNHLNLFREMRTLRRQNPSISPEEILKMATLNGAKGLKSDRILGSLERGKSADVIGVKVNRDVNLYHEIIDAEKVELTIIDGKIAFDPHGEFPDPTYS